MLHCTKQAEQIPVSKGQYAYHGMLLLFLFLLSLIIPLLPH